MNGKTAAVLGATGLIGSHLLEQLVSDDDFSLIKVIVRRSFSINRPKVQVIVIDFSDHQAFRQAIAGSQIVFCAVGTTQKKVKGNQAAYRKVDYDIPVTAARFCEETGVQQFLLVSSIGANSKSRSFYTRLKGEVEDAVKALHIPSISIFRPSLLLGHRQEFRFGEKVAEVLFKPLSVLFPSNYKPIKASIVARAMIRASKIAKSGWNLFYYQDMNNL